MGGWVRRRRRRRPKELAPAVGLAWGGLHRGEIGRATALGRRTGRACPFSHHSFPHVHARALVHSLTGPTSLSSRLAALNADAGDAASALCFVAAVDDWRWLWEDVIRGGVAAFVRGLAGVAVERLGRVPTAAAGGVRYTSTACWRSSRLHRCLRTDLALNSSLIFFCFYPTSFLSSSRAPSPFWRGQCWRRPKTPRSTSPRRAHLPRRAMRGSEYTRPAAAWLGGGKRPRDTARGLL